MKTCLLCFFFGGSGGGILPSSMDVLLLIMLLLLPLSLEFPSTWSPSGADIALRGINDICWMQPDVNDFDGLEQSTLKIVSSSPSGIWK